MRGQVPRLTKLATDLLDLSRLDAGRLTVADESLDLAVVGELLVTEFGPRVAASQHTLELDAAATGRRARGRRGRACCRSAGSSSRTRSCTRRREPRSASRSDAEGGRATLSVTDDGPGIPEDDRQAVFERFYRLGGTVASGSGLGLAIARELAELMGGRVELESRPGLDALHARASGEAGRSAPALAALGSA